MIITGDPCPACGISPWTPEHANAIHDAGADSLGELMEWAAEEE